MRISKKELQKKVTELDSIVTGRGKFGYGIKRDYESLQQQYQKLQESLTEKINEVLKTNKNLQETVGKLKFQIENPAKHKVGDIIKGKIVTKVEIIPKIKVNMAMLGLFIPNEPFYINYYEWQYSVTDTKTGETGTL